MATKKIVFIQNFTSPVHGNVYVGKKATLPHKEADAFIRHGHAKEDDGKDVAAKAAALVGKPDTPPAVDPYKGMTDKQKAKAIAKAAQDAANAKAAAIKEKKNRLDELLELEPTGDAEKDAANALEIETLEADLAKLQA